ncbi:MAG: DUF2330 domain-containing protein [Deltaproteobacteria bacterium]
MILRKNAALLLSSTAALTFSALTPTPAEACGGLFCANTPVNQAEEAIIFEVTEGGRDVTAIINIVYQGSAEEFAWVLPLQTAPESIEVGSRQAFLTAQGMTAPQFNITEYETVGSCDEQVWLASQAEDASAGGGPQPPANRNSGVEVIERKEVGPYDTVVLEGRDPEAVQGWLVENGFRVTDEMMDMVTPYLAQGDTLVALKLLNDKDVGEITPIEVKMTASEAKPDLEACIPIRMTAMAANTDMPITAYVFSDEGRAIPQNFFHVKPNLLKIDWINWGANYRDVISRAVDEADQGHAFVTEYAGSPDIFDGMVYDPAQINLSAFASLRDLADFLNALQEQGILRRPGVRSILESHFPAIADCNAGCGSEQFRGTLIEDPQALIDEIDEKVLAPDRRAQELMTRNDYFTRLFTLLDPKEMTLDPQFTYRKDLDDVSNVHTAKMIMYCGLGGAPGDAGVQIILEDGRSIYYDSSFEPDMSVIDAMPAAERVEQLAEDRVVRDNSNEIGDLLQRHNEINDLSGCGCEETSTQRSAGLSIAALALCGFGLLMRRRRR